MKKHIVKGALALSLVGAVVPGISMINQPIVAQAAVIGDDYPAKWKNLVLGGTTDDWGMSTRYCTSFVAWRLSSANKYNLPRIYGNADTWGYTAKNNGIRVDMNPAVGAVAWWNTMHVAWVAEVSGDQVLIEEYNWDYTGTYHKRWIPKNSVSGYIHFKDMPTTPNLSDSKFKVNNYVKIKSVAGKTADGKDLVAKRGWGAIVKSVKVDVKSNSKYSYTLRYDNGQEETRVLEQDIELTPVDVNKSKFKVGNYVKIKNIAGKTADGKDLVAKRGKAGLIMSVKADVNSNSKYTYVIYYDDGQQESRVLEQDIEAATINLAQAKFKKDDYVKIKNTAVKTADGKDLVVKRNLEGKITDVKIDPNHHSKFTYIIQYNNGTVETRVLEQDIEKVNLNINDAKYKLEEKVRIKDTAFKTVEGVDLTAKRGKTAIVSKIQIDPKDKSRFSYNLKYEDGSVEVRVLEQDLDYESLNLGQSKYKVGNTVKVAAVAGQTVDGKDLVAKRGFEGTITAVQIDVKSRSNFSYTVKYSNGQSDSRILEQDLEPLNINIANSKFKVGNVVQVKDLAINTFEGKDLKAKRGYEGTVTSVQVELHSKSRYSYNIKYKNGQSDTRILEQDLDLAPTTWTLKPVTGTHVFTARASVKAEPRQSSSELAYYDKGQSVYYDHKTVFDGYEWISYIAASGNRRYIAIRNIYTTASSYSIQDLPAITGSGINTEESYLEMTKEDYDKHIKEIAKAEEKSVDIEITGREEKYTDKVPVSEEVKDEAKDIKEVKQVETTDSGEK